MEQREEVERRVLALLRSRLDECDEWHTDGYEIGDFLLVYQIFTAPHPEGELDPWAGGPYSGWDTDIGFVTSSESWWFDEAVLRECLTWVRRTRHQMFLDDRYADDEEEPEEGEDQPGDGELADG